MGSEKSPTAAPTRAGITTDAEGQRHIASSVRADGSVRKEIKIRPGYRPPEDVDLYKNRTAEAFRTRGTGGVPGASATAEEDSSKSSSASNKNAKRREARKKAKAVEDDGKDETVEKESQVEEKAIEADDEVENEKKAKRLKKKLREARELQAKKEKGEGLLQEQFEKVIRINELMKDLEKLGFKDDDNEAKVREQ